MCEALLQPGNWNKGHTHAPWRRAPLHVGRLFFLDLPASDYQLCEERGTAPSEGDSEPVRDCGPKIGKGFALPEVSGNDPQASREQRHYLARVIRRRRSWVIAVVGRNEEQVVLFEM